MIRSWLESVIYLIPKHSLWHWLFSAICCLFVVFFSSIPFFTNITEYSKKATAFYLEKQRENRKISVQGILLNRGQVNCSHLHQTIGIFYKLFYCLYSHTHCICLDCQKKPEAVTVIMLLSAEKICKEELLLRLQNGHLGNNLVTIFMLLNVSLRIKSAHLEKHVDVVQHERWLAQTHSCYLVSPYLQERFLC